MAATFDTSMEPEFRAGVVLERRQSNDVYTLVQKQHTDGLRKELSGNSSTIDFNYGPLHVKGYVNPQTLGLTVTVDILGINLGTLRGDLKNSGLTIKVSLFVVEGEVKLYLKNTNEVWIRLHLEVTFDGTFDEDVKLLEL
ncbi:integral membrane protein [Apiospora arundinis]